MPSNDTKKNLVMFSDLTEEERREMASRAGKASVKRRRELKTMRETLKLVLSQKVPKDGAFYRKHIEVLKALGFKGDPTVQDLANFGLLSKVLKGDPTAYSVMRDTIGEKPVEQTEDITPEPPIVLGLFNPGRVEDERGKIAAQKAEDANGGSVVPAGGTDAP